MDNMFLTCKRLWTIKLQEKELHFENLIVKFNSLLMEHIIGWNNYGMNFNY